MNYSAIEAGGESERAAAGGTRGKNREVGEQFSQLLHGIMGAGSSDGVYGAAVNLMDLAPTPVGTEVKVAPPAEQAVASRKNEVDSKDGGQGKRGVKEEPKEMGPRVKHDSRKDESAEEAAVLRAAEEAVSKAAAVEQETPREELVSRPMMETPVETPLARIDEVPDELTEHGMFEQSAGKQAVAVRSTAKQAEQAQAEMNVPQEFEEQVVGQESAPAQLAPKQNLRPQPMPQGESRMEQAAEEMPGAEIAGAAEETGVPVTQHEAETEGAASAEETLRLQLAGLLGNGRSTEAGASGARGASGGPTSLTALNGIHDKGEAEKASVGAKKKTLQMPRSQQQQVVDKVKSMLENAAASKTGTTMTLKLNPAELGAVTVRVTERSGRIFARITPESQEVEHLLRTKVGEVTQTLTNAGFRADDIHISVGQERSESETYQFSEFFGNRGQQQGENRGEMSGRREQGDAGAGLLNHTAIPVQQATDVAGWVA